MLKAALSFLFRSPNCDLYVFTLRRFVVACLTLRHALTANRQHWTDASRDDGTPNFAIHRVWRGSSALLLVYTIVAIAFSGADALPLLIGEFILTSYAGLLICYGLPPRQIKL